MKTASIEICKELHELSGWEDTYSYKYLSVNADWVTTHTEYPHLVGMGEHNFPAYDLGYLLRKLPININVGNFFESFTLDIYVGQWSCRYGLKAPTRIEGRGDTPEDAAAKLAIELFKLGILTKGSDGAA